MHHLLLLWLTITISLAVSYTDGWVCVPPPPPKRNTLSKTNRLPAWKWFICLRCFGEEEWGWWFGFIPTKSRTLHCFVLAIAEFAQNPLPLHLHFLPKKERPVGISAIGFPSVCAFLVPSLFLLLLGSFWILTHLTTRRVRQLLESFFSDECSAAAKVCKSMNKNGYHNVVHPRGINKSTMLTLLFSFP